MLIGLSIKLGISIAEVERWDLETVREYIVVLAEQRKPAAQAAQTPEEVESGLIAAYGRPKK